MKQWSLSRFTVLAPHGAASGRLAWGLAGAAILVSIVGFVVSVVYAVVTGDTSAIFSHVALNPFITVAYASVGALVASRHPRNPIGWIFLVVGALLALNIGATAFVDASVMLTGQSAEAATRFLHWFDTWFWVPTLSLPTIFVFLLFPDGRLLSSRWRMVAWSAALGLALTVLVLALPAGANQDGLPAPALEFLENAGYLLLVIGLVGAIASFVLRYRRSRGGQRQQMKWPLYAVFLTALYFLVASIIWYAFPGSVWAEELAIALSNLMLLAIGVAASIAILRYRLYDIDLLINRTLVYTMLTASIVALYALIVGGLGALFQAWSNPIVALLATGLVAVLFQPLRDRLQRAVNRFMYGERDEPFGVLAQLGERLESTLSPELVFPTIVETIAQRLKLPYVALAIWQDGRLELVEAAGKLVGEPVPFPLSYQGEQIGQLLVGRRAPDEPLGPVDRRILRNIARQAGVAAHAVQLMTDLQRSRQQLVTAREEERRRLRRDLHDGLGASLAGLNLQVGALRRAIRRDPAQAEALADELRGDIRATIDDIRRLVYELRPPTLDQLGLVAAVRAQAAQCSRPVDQGERGLQVTIHAPEELPPLPAAVEVAAYRIAQEALTNVVHHARARHCHVRLEVEDALTLEIVDDGIGGVDARYRRQRGLGLISMRERALELGGDCVIEQQPGGGTRVSACLPLAEV